MRKPLIAGNWKMNKTVEETVEFISEFKKKEWKDKDVLICPPFTALSEAKKAVEGSSIHIWHCYCTDIAVRWLKLIQGQRSHSAIRVHGVEDIPDSWYQSQPICQPR